MEVAHRASDIAGRDLVLEVQRDVGRDVGRTMPCSMSRDCQDIEHGIVDGVLDLSKHDGWKMSFSAKLVSFYNQKACADFTGARAP